MIRRLCESLGAPLPVYNDQLHYAFPSPEDLCRPGTEELLRELGFGYRAPYIYKTALLLCELASEAQCTPHEYLDSLSKLPYTEARAALLQFVGVGPKVADCVALFGLGFAHVVPVDTHVWQIAVRDYGFKGKEAKGPCGAAVYEKVQQHLQGIWGDKAGWAQQVCLESVPSAYQSYEATDPVYRRPGILCELCRSAHYAQKRVR
jgi:N-glycosylase/DNA lyase